MSSCNSRKSAVEIVFLSDMLTLVTNFRLCAFHSGYYSNTHVHANVNNRLDHSYQTTNIEIVA